MTTRTSLRSPASFHVALVAAAASCAIAATQPAIAIGETITVNTVNDVVDFGAPQQVANLPGPDGRVSFREAVIAANNTAGPQTIAFAVPENEWWLVTDMALLRQEDGIFNLIDDETTVDFTTQTAFTGDTNPNGGEVGIYGLEPNAWGVAAIYVNGDNCVIRGLGNVHQRGYGVRIVGHNNRVIGCTIGGPLYAGVYITGGFNGTPPTGNIVGGTEPGEGNILSAGNSGVRIDGPAQDNIVIGNQLSGSFWGVEVRSASCCPGNDAINNRIGGPTPAERNIISGAGKFGEEGFPTGGQVNLEYAIGTIVEGNWIGLATNGNSAPAIQRGPIGVRVSYAPNSIVRNNVISGIAITGVNHAAGQRFGVGVSVSGVSPNPIVQGNLIGTDAAGNAGVPNHRGVVVSSALAGDVPTGVIIGGTAPGQPNTIAFNEQQGVRIDSQIAGVRISGNSIHSNAALGIDLIGSGIGAGVTPNDLCDGDSGGNNLQNFPVLAKVTSTASSSVVAGTLNSTPNTTFELQFFASQQADSSLHGEGQLYLGSTTVTTDGGCEASFNVTLPSAAPVGWFASATAIAPNGDTSEFALVEEITAGTSVAGDVNGDGTVDVSDVLAVIGAWGPCPASPTPCPADIVPSGGDGVVNVNELLMVINNWG